LTSSSLEPAQASVAHRVSDGVGGVVVLASWHIGGIVTEQGDIIEYGALRAADLAGVNTILTNVEVSAIVWVQVTRMVIFGTITSDLCGVRAGEPIQYLCFLDTASPEASSCPLAGASELIKDQTAGTLAEHRSTGGALIILHAVGWVLMLEVTILAGALDASGLGRLQVCSSWAFYNEGVVALLDFGSQGVVEDQAIRAQLLRRLSSVTIIVFVTLVRVHIEAIFHALEMLC